MTAVTESAPDPVALAFAVAALQSVKGDSSNMKVPTTCDQALVSPSSSAPSSSTMYFNNFVSHQNSNDDFRSAEHSNSSVMSVSEQCPGSGSDSREVDDDHTIATTLSTSPSPTPTASTKVVPWSSTRGKNKNTEQDANTRLARSRDRNREHARRTRIRKKAQLAALQTKVARLEAERVTLRQSIEECSIAGILLGLHQTGTEGKEDDDDDHEATLLENVNSTKDASANSTSSTKVALLANGKRKRFLEQDENTPEAFKQPSQPIKLMIDGKTALVGGGKSHINWKTGIYIDHAGLHSKLTPAQLENLRYVFLLCRILILSRPRSNAVLNLSCIVQCSHTRRLHYLPLPHSIYSRERNRMHAKMTRDRKKCFIATIEKTIDELESDVNRMRSILKQVSGAKFTFTNQVTPMGSPELSAKEGPSLPDDDDMDNDDDDLSVYSQVVVKKAKHGFSLND
jgi:hypothetical protein